MKTFGGALVVLGVVVLLVSSMGFNRQTTVLDLGGIKATATEHRTFPIAAVAGVLAMIGGVVLLVLPRPTHS